MTVSRSHISRRAFFTASGATLAGLSLGTERLRALTVTIPSTARARRTCPDAWLPDPLSADELRVLAAVAMDAARSAGADFADIRLGVQRMVRVYGYPSGPSVGLSMGYGIRAWYGGTWSFQHGNVLTPDAIAATARNAVAGARTYERVNAWLAAHRRNAPALPPTEWAPVPVATGEWRVPVQIDPFGVAIDDYYRAIGATVSAVAPDNVYRSATAGGYLLEWDTELRVIASTAGTLVTQETMCGGLNIQSLAMLAGESDDVFLRSNRFNRVCGGFETALRPELLPEVRQLRDEAARWRELPFRSFRDVGRFPVVLDGVTTARLVANIVGSALDGDRVFGLEADASGGSFLMPADDVLRASKPYFSPSLNIRVNRTLPSPMAVQWDDDGVVPESYDVVTAGRVVDFHTTRETAPRLAEWYRQQGRAVRSHGGAFASTPANVPCCVGGHHMVAPSTTPASLTDLTREVSHGFLVIGGGVGATPGLTGGVISNGNDGVTVEIRRGVPVARTDATMQFVTQMLLNRSLTALGDATTVGSSESEISKGMPWQSLERWATAPAALCSEVDIVYS